jgi:hypothetical protein
MYKKLIQRRFQMQEQMNNYFMLKPLKFHLVYVTTVPSSLTIVDFIFIMMKFNSFINTRT